MRQTPLSNKTYSDLKSELNKTFRFLVERKRSLKKVSYELKSSLINPAESSGQINEGTGLMNWLSTTLNWIRPQETGQTYETTKSTRTDYSNPTF